MAYQLKQHRPTPFDSDSRTSDRFVLKLGSVVLAALALSLGCGEEFEPYSQVTELRVLAVGSDKPSLAPGQSATLDALVFEPGGSDLTYKWSWCPFTTGSFTGYECAASEEEINEGLANAGFSLPSFDLGTGPTAQLAYPDPPEVVPLICSLLVNDELPDFFRSPDCDRGIDVTVKVVVSGAGQTITSVRTIELLASGDLVPNNNPSALSLSMIETDPSTEAEESILIRDDGSTVLDRGRDYTLRLDIAENSSESFVRVEPGSPPSESFEILAVSWFVEDGELENERTGFLEKGSTLQEGGQNVWKTPTAVEFEASRINVFLVLRDERGGVSWLNRQVQLSP